MTPNLNPSPEERAAVEKLTRPIIGMENRTPLEVRDILFDRIRSHFAALPPPTPAETVTVALPGAGEVDTQWEVWEDDLMVASSTDEADARHYLAVYLEDGPVRFVKAVTVRTPVDSDASPTLATGAAANDEGVARKWFPHLCWAGEPMHEGQFREPWPMGEERTALAKAIFDGWYEGNEDWDSPHNDHLQMRAYFAADAAIRLLSQGGGK